MLRIATGAVQTANHATATLTEMEEPPSGRDGETTTTTATIEITEGGTTGTGGEGEMIMTTGDVDG